MDWDAGLEILMPKPVIAIDGPAASGKGTLSRRLADHLGFAHMDTGALYRAVGYIALQNDDDPTDEANAIKAATQLGETFTPSMLDNPELRTDTTGQAASKVAAHQPVRDALLKLQRDFALTPGDAYKGAVLDGRDIGTVICPEADVKLFVTADIEIRIERRYKELQSKGISVNCDTVSRDMRERDARDTQRSAAPLIPADDAKTLDTGAYTADEVFNQALAIVEETLN
jgi:cytidylate kinase